MDAGPIIVRFQKGPEICLPALLGKVVVVIFCPFLVKLCFLFSGWRIWHICQNLALKVSVFWHETRLIVVFLLCGLVCFYGRGCHI